MMGSSNKYIVEIAEQAQSFCPQCLTKHLEYATFSVFI